MLTRLANRHARLTIELSFSDHVVDMLEQGFDLAVRLGQLRDSATLTARRLVTDRFVMCASSAYLARRGHPQNPDDFAGHTGILYMYPGRETPWQMRDANGKLKDLRVERRLRFDDVQAIADAAIAGAGIARLPRWLVAPYLRGGELVLLPETEGEMEQLHAVWPNTRYLPAKTRAAIDALAKEIPAMLA